MNAYARSRMQFNAPQNAQGSYRNSRNEEQGIIGSILLTTIPITILISHSCRRQHPNASEGRVQACACWGRASPALIDQPLHNVILVPQVRPCTLLEPQSSKSSIHAEPKLRHNKSLIGILLIFSPLWGIRCSILFGLKSHMDSA